jgi:putative endonuclease
MAERKWVVYLLECRDGSYYTGVTNDVDKRMKAHAEGKGSKYVAAKGFGRLLAVKECNDKADACRAEWAVKQLPRGEKLMWFEEDE